MPPASTNSHREPARTAGRSRSDLHPDAQGSSRQREGQRSPEFFSWAYQNGDEMALQLDYIPMPDDVVKLVESAVEVPDQGLGR